jgi:heme-degrading monooxygenase HmoA
MHVIMWAFVVRPDKVGEFVSAYKGDGDWAQLFSLAAGYQGTELLSCTDDAERFVTIDRWDNVADYARFRERFGPQYRYLDAQLEGLTLSETKLGTFATTGE